MPQVQNSMAHIASDPLRNFKFEAFIHHPAVFGNYLRMGFMSISGLNINTEVIPYREGGMNTTTQKMPGQSDFAPITLSKGVVIGDHSMLEWMKQMFFVIQGAGTNPGGVEFRAMIDVYVKDHPATKGEGANKAGFRIYNAWPSSIAFSDLDAGANAILLQQMTLAHEGFEARIAHALGPGQGSGFNATGSPAQVKF